jgi:hypothetical protein
LFDLKNLCLLSTLELCLILRWSWILLDLKNVNFPWFEHKFQIVFKIENDVWIWQKNWALKKSSLSLLSTPKKIIDSRKRNWTLLDLKNFGFCICLEKWRWRFRMHKLQTLWTWLELKNWKQSFYFENQHWILLDICDKWKRTNILGWLHMQIFQKQW